MRSQVRLERFLHVMFAGFLLTLGVVPPASSEGAPAAPSELVCPGGGTLASALAPYDALDRQRAKLESALAAAEGGIQTFQQLKADHASGQRVLGVFQATDASVAAITAVSDTLKTAANLIRDVGAEVDPSLTIKAWAKGSEAIESVVEFVRKDPEAESNCDLGSPGEDALMGFVADKARVGAGLNLAKNLCKTLEHQTAHSDLSRTHRQALGRLESEISKWGERARSLRSQLATVESKRRGLERQCTAFTEEQKKAAQLADFVLEDAERSRGIAEHQNDAATARLAQSGTALDWALQQINTNAAQMSLQQQMRALEASRSRPTSNRAPAAMPSLSSARQPAERTCNAPAHLVCGIPITFCEVTGPSCRRGSTYCECR